MFGLLARDAPTDYDGQIICDEAIGATDPVAIVSLAGHDSGVLQDYAIPGPPIETCRSTGLPEQLIDPHHVVIGWSSGVYAVVDLPEVRYHWFELPSPPGLGSSTLLAVSPALDAVVWLMATQAEDLQSPRELHLTTNEGDQRIATLADSLTGFCGLPDDWSRESAYSPSGKYFFSLDHPRSIFTDSTGAAVPGTDGYALRVFDGATPVLEVLPPGDGWPEAGHPAMAVWSPIEDALYYRQGHQVWRWTPDAGGTIFAPDLGWSSPTFTADGRHLAYVRSGDLYLVDMADGPPGVLLKHDVTSPIFLNTTQLWFQQSQPTGCVGEGVANRMFDISGGVESASDITGVRAVWPATSSDH